jgi:hypothetical protein
MSSIRTKITYECACGCDFGSCGRQNYFLLAYHNGSDTAVLYHKDHADKPLYPSDGVLEIVANFDENKLAALAQLLTQKREDSESWTREDHAETDAIRHA